MKTHREARPEIKPNIKRVIPEFADEALWRANGDRKAAYSQYIRIIIKVTNRVDPGCDDRDLQAYYDLKGI